MTKQFVKTSKRNARALRNRWLPRNARGHLLPHRMGNMHGLNAWLLSNEYRVRS